MVEQTNGFLLLIFGRYQFSDMSGYVSGDAVVRAFVTTKGISKCRSEGSRRSR